MDLINVCFMVLGGFLIGLGVGYEFGARAMREIVRQYDELLGDVLHKLREMNKK